MQLQHATSSNQELLLHNSSSACAQKIYDPFFHKSRIQYSTVQYSTVLIVAYTSPRSTSKLARSSSTACSSNSIDLVVQHLGVVLYICIQPRLYRLTHGFLPGADDAPADERNLFIPTHTQPQQQQTSLCSLCTEVPIPACFGGPVR